MELNLNKQATTTEKVLHVHVAVTEPTKFELLEQSVADKRLHFFLKRSFDIAVSSLLILLFAPILITVALIIKLTSKGPILYSNDRVGLEGINFKCHKFRSMVSDHSI